MKFSLRKTVRTRWYARHKLLLWATLISLLLGASTIGEPLDRGLRLVRFNKRSVPASGQIVIAGISDRSIQSVGKWPWSNDNYARLVDHLNTLGAKRILFDIDFVPSTGSVGDKSFERSLERSSADIVMATRLVTDPVTGVRSEYAPPPAFRKYAELANVQAWNDQFLGVMDIDYRREMGGYSYPTLAAVLGNRTDQTGNFLIDYAVDMRSLPLIDTADILSGGVRREQIAGKDVVIGTTSPRMGDLFLVAKRGPTSQVFVHVLAGETLLRGKPAVLGWVPAFLLAFGIAYWSQTRRARKLLSRLSLPAAFIAILVAPLFLESHLIFVDIVPALLLLAIVGSVRAWARFRRKSINVNSVTGLPSLNALREDNFAPQTVLIVMRVNNFAEIASALPLDQEKELVRHILSRIATAWERATVHQGDEGIFAWLVSTQTSISISDELEALHLLFRNPIMVHDRPIDLDVSFGVEAGGDRLLANRLGSAMVAADEAHAEGSRWKIFDRAKLENAEWRLSLLSRLDNAIDEGEIWVAFQPIVDLKTNRVIAAEALARWTHPDRGEISPADFIPAAEQHNRIERLTEHVLREAIQAAVAINAETGPLTVAVNLSARLLDSPKIVDTIERLLLQYRLSPEHLTLEVTESAEITDGEVPLHHLEQLRMLGVGIALDDYGTGFSTLAYFKKVPADEIKIDRNFVGVMHKSRSDQLMVSSTIELAHSLGRRVIAEGVERIDTMAMLESMGCDAAQGYLISRPMPLHQFKPWLDQRHVRLVA